MLFRSLETETLKQMQENLGLRSDMMVRKDEESEKFVIHPEDRDAHMGSNS